MKVMGRVLALMLAVVLAVGCLASCVFGEEPDAAEIIGAAEGVLDMGIYSATVHVEIESGREDINDALGGITASDVSVVVNGSSFCVSMDISSNGVGIVKSYTAKDGVLYGLTELTLGGQTTSIKKKAELGESTVADLLSAIGAGAEVGHDDFFNVSVSGEDGDYEIVCSQITADAKDSLNNIMASGFEGSDIATTLQDVTYTIKIKDGMYESTTLEATYAITEPNDAYTLTVLTVTAYEYGTAPKIDAPADAESYESVSIDSITK